MSRQARILLVDDRRENLFALDAILSPLNQILVPVRSGEEALEALLADEFAVVLLDIVMPGMNGLETAARIKQNAKICSVPIIFLTAALAQPEQPFLGYAAGAVDYLAKPFDPGVLMAKVSIFVDLYLKASQLRDQVELLGQTAGGRRGSGRRAGPASGREPGRRGERGDRSASRTGRPAARHDRRARLARTSRARARPDLRGVTSRLSGA